MIASLSIEGVPIPLVQVTLRRSLDRAEMTLQLAGWQSVSIGDAVLLAVAGVEIAGIVSSVDTGLRSTGCTATVTPATGSGEYAPARIQAMSSGMVRGDVDFSVMPGDTYAGIGIAEVTHTIGANSPAFTEARW